MQNVIFSSSVIQDKAMSPGWGWGPEPAPEQANGHVCNLQHMAVLKGSCPLPPSTSCFFTACSEASVPG